MLYQAPVHLENIQRCIALPAVNAKADLFYMYVSLSHGKSLRRLTGKNKIISIAGFLSDTLPENADRMG